MNLIKRFNSGDLNFLLFVIVLNLIIYNAKSPRSTILNIKEGFSGSIQTAYRSRSIHVIINNLETMETNDITVAHTDFLCCIDIGDLVFKKPNDNYIEILKNDGRKLKCFFVYIPDSQRRDFRWPKEWKDKWLGASSNSAFDTCAINKFRKI